MKVRGEVRTLFTPKIFTIEGSAPGGLLALSRDALAGVPKPTTGANAAQNDIIEVTGTVVPFERARIAQHTGENVTVTTLGAQEGRPAILAETVVRMPAPEDLREEVRETRSEDGAEDTGVVTAQIRQVGVVVRAPNPRQYVGQRMELTGVKVQSMVGDKSFFVGPSPQEQIFVVLVNALDRGQMERLLDVDSGQTLNLSGIVRAMPTLSEARDRWELDGNEGRMIQKEKVYLHADRVVFR